MFTFLKSYFWWQHLQSMQCNVMCISTLCVICLSTTKLKVDSAGTVPRVRSLQFVRWNHSCNSFISFYPTWSSVVCEFCFLPWHWNYLWITNSSHKLQQNPKISDKLLPLNILTQLESSQKRQWCRVLLSEIISQSELIKKHKIYFPLTMRTPYTRRDRANISKLINIRVWRKKGSV